MQKIEAFNELKNELIEQLKNSTKEVLTSKEAAEYLGISISQIYRLTSRGIIPHYKPTGKICYFKRDELDEWATAERYRICTAQEAEQAAQDYCNKRRCAL